MNSTKACWKCRATLRVADAAYCPVCGAPQQGHTVSAPPAAKVSAPDASERVWNRRIEEVSNLPGTGLAWLWVLLFPLWPITYPILLMRANRRLREHVNAHLASPGMQAQRVTQVPEGQAVAAQLRGVAGGIGAGVLPLLISLLLLSVCVFTLFLIPAQAPRPISYQRALESVLEAGRSYTHVSFSSADDYESFWRYQPTYKYDDIEVTTTSNYSREARWAGIPTDLPTYNSKAPSVTSMHRPPYEYLVRGSGGPPEYRRVTGLSLYWEETETAGVLFWVSGALLYLTFAIFGLHFWARYARHRQAEVLAAAYVAGDPGLHDQLLPLVRQRNSVLKWIVVPLAISGLHTGLFPVLSVKAFSRHATWEQRSGIGPILGRSQ